MLKRHGRDRAPERLMTECLTMATKPSLPADTATAEQDVETTLSM